MIKVIVDLGKINNRMRMKFHLILRYDDRGKTGEIISTFPYKGSTYVKIIPHPVIVLEFSNMLENTKEIWNPNNSVMLTPPFLYKMIRGIEEIQKAFTVKDLYYYTEDKKLKVDADLAQKSKVFVRLMQKTICMSPAVIQDARNAELEYEGIMFMVNSVDNFCCLTITELDYLRYRLASMDLHTMSLHVLSLKSVTDILANDTIAQTSAPDIVIEHDDVQPFLNQPVMPIPEKPSSTIPKLK